MEMEKNQKKYTIRDKSVEQAQNIKPQAGKKQKMSWLIYV